MQPSGEMQNFINACELKHKTYLEDTGDKLKMRLGRRDLTLVAQRTGLNTVRVAHELVNSDGNLVYDPEVIFFTGYEKWIALEITAASTIFTEIGKRGTHKVYATLNSTGTAIKDCKFGKQKELAQFVKYWVRLLKSRGWHEDSTNALYQQASLFSDAEDGSDDDDEDDAGEGAAATQRFKDLVGDELIGAGLMADEPTPMPRRGRGGVNSVTLSSANQSVTLTGKH